MVESDYPEHARLSAVKKDADIIAGFLEWAFFEREWMFAKFDEEDRLWPVDNSIEKLLAGYFGIDLNLIKEEKGKVIDSAIGA